MTAAPPSRNLDLLAGAAVALLAAGLFLHGSGAVPAGYREDTVSVALNALCLVETGADEYGARWPLVGFRSLGDYKGSLNLYLVAALFVATGPSLHAARLLSIGLTSAAVLALALTLRRARPDQSAWGAPADACFFALFLLSSWLLVTPRVLVENGVLLAASAAAVVTALGVAREPQSLTGGLVAGACAGLLSHCYSPGKVLFAFSPLILALTIACEPPRGGRKLTGFAGLRGYVASWLLVAAPHLFDLFGERKGLSRFDAVGGHFDLVDIGRAIARNASPSFLFFTGDPVPAHHFGLGGMLNVFFLPLVIWGLVVATRRFGCDALARYALLLLPVAYLPVGIARQTPPHALRALLASVPILIISFYGWRAAQAVARKRGWARLLLAAWTILGVIRCVHGLAVFFGPYAERNLGGFVRPLPRWNASETKPDPADHGVDTLFERYHRATRGDLTYCAGSRSR